MTGHGLLIWPSGPSTPPDAPPWADDEHDALDVLICTDCGEEFLAGQSCRCSEPSDDDSGRP